MKKCDCCGEKKEPFFINFTLCKEYAEKMDKYIIKEIDNENE